MKNKPTIAKFILICCIFFHSCNITEKKELVVLSRTQIPKVTLPIPETKDTVIFIPPPVMIDDYEYPPEPPFIEEPPIIDEKPDTIPPKPYFVAEIMPEFDGGKDAMWKYILENLRYPQTDADVQGRVVLRFTVTKEGNIEDVTVLKSIDYQFDKEAIKVIKSMPKWIPGQQNGEYVDVYYTLPVSFKLMSE